MDIDQAKQTFLTVKPQIDALKGQMKELRKEIKGACSAIYDYLRDNDLESIDVGGHVFSLETKTRVKFTREDFEALLPNPADISNYEVTEQKGRIKRRRA